MPSTQESVALLLLITDNHHARLLSCTRLQSGHVHVKSIATLLVAVMTVAFSWSFPARRAHHRNARTCAPGCSLGAHAALRCASQGVFAAR
jgi:hypothetical protein